MEDEPWSLCGLRIPELGNVFMEFEDWRERYAALLQCAGHLLIGRLEVLEPPVWLLCYERCVADRHRLQNAQFLALRSAIVEHLE